MISGYNVLFSVSWSYKTKFISSPLKKVRSSDTVFAIEPIVLVDRNICFSPHTIHEGDLVHARFIAFKGDRLLDINENKNEATGSSLGVVTSLIYILYDHLISLDSIAIRWERAVKGYSYALCNLNHMRENSKRRK